MTGIAKSLPVRYVIAAILVLVPADNMMGVQSPGGPSTFLTGIPVACQHGPSPTPILSPSVKPIFRSLSPTFPVGMSRPAKRRFGTVYVVFANLSPRLRGVHLGRIASERRIVGMLVLRRAGIRAEYPPHELLGYRDPALKTLPAGRTSEAEEARSVVGRKNLRTVPASLIPGPPRRYRIFSRRYLQQARTTAGATNNTRVISAEFLTALRTCLLHANEDT